MKLLSMLMLVLFVSLGVGCSKKEAMEEQPEISTPTETPEAAPEAVPGETTEQQPTQNQ